MKLSVVLLIAFALLFASNANAQLSWDSCGEDGFQLNSVTVSPEAPAIGDTITITASADFQDTVTSGKVQATVHYGIIKVYDDSLDLCGLSPDYTCPFSGSISVQQSAEVPKIAFAGKYKGKVVLTNQDNKQFGCFTFTLKLSKASLVSADENEVLLDQEIVNQVNAQEASLWKASLHPLFSRLNVGQAKELLREPVIDTERLDQVSVNGASSVAVLPVHFDTREQWPSCVGETAANDRFCIQFNGKRPAASGANLKYRRMQMLQGETTMMHEIMRNGPIEVAMEVYQDFFGYEGGIYRHESGAFVGHHVVKVVGWNVDPITEQPFWIVQNSFGTGWGMNGYSWILRGSNECNVEMTAVSGEPELFE